MQQLNTGSQRRELARTYFVIIWLPRCFPIKKHPYNAIKLINKQSVKDG